MLLCYFDELPHQKRRRLRAQPGLLYVNVTNVLLSRLMYHTIVDELFALLQVSSHAVGREGMVGTVELWYGGL
jgi:hypothetical protein